MGPLHFKQLPRPSVDMIRQSQARMRGHNNAIWRMVFASERTVQETSDAIERADTVLARRLSEGS